MFIDIYLPTITIFEIVFTFKLFLTLSDLFI